MERNQDASPGCERQFESPGVFSTYSDFDWINQLVSSIGFKTKLRNCSLVQMYRLVQVYTTSRDRGESRWYSGIWWRHRGASKQEGAAHDSIRIPEPLQGVLD